MPALPGLILSHSAGARPTALLKIVLMKSQANGAQFLSYFETHHTEMLEFVRWLVEQESMSRVAEATRRIAENFGDRLAEIGAAVDLLHDPHYGATVRARFAAHDATASPEDQQLL